MELRFAAPESLPDGARVDLLPPGADADPDEWLAERLGPPRPALRLLSDQETETASGWPMILRTYAVDGSLAVTAIYFFFDLSAVVVARGLAEGWVRAREGELLAAMRAASPVWQSGEPLVVSELWAEIPARP